MRKPYSQAVRENRKTNQQKKALNKNEKKKHIFSLNSLAVRVPHNFSRRVSAGKTPDPLLVAGWLVAGGGWSE